MSVIIILSCYYFNLSLSQSVIALSYYYLNERNEEVIFIGDGIPAFKQIIDEKLTAGHFYARQQLSRQRATTIGAIAWDMYRAGEIENADLFAPDYLRLSQAERERMERDKENGK